MGAPIIIVISVQLVLIQILLHLFLCKQTTGFIHLVKGLVDLKAQVGGEFQVGCLAKRAAQLAFVAGKGLNCNVFALTAKGQNISGGDLQVRRGAHLAHRDRHPVQLRVMYIAARQHVRKRAADQFSHPQLSLRRAIVVVKSVLCHGVHIGGNA